MSLHCLNTEVNSQLSAIVDCSTEQQFEELLEVYSSHTSIDRFKKWFDKNYRKTMLYGVELYAVHVKT